MIDASQEWCKLGIVILIWYPIVRVPVCPFATCINITYSTLIRTTVFQQLKTLVVTQAVLRQNSQYCDCWNVNQQDGPVEPGGRWTRNGTHYRPGCCTPHRHAAVWFTWQKGEHLWHQKRKLRGRTLPLSVASVFPLKLNSGKTLPHGKERVDVPAWLQKTTSTSSL